MPARFGPRGVADTLTMAGIEVESITPLFQETGIVVGRVEEIRPHPRSDHLSLCRVDAGGTKFPVVCGAPNVRVGIKAPLAKEGILLLDGTQVKSTTIRGEISNGMLCSERELALSEDHKGIMILSDKAPLGRPAYQHLGLNDWLIEVGVTPNRGDCLGILGLAREVSALRGNSLKTPSVSPHGNNPGLKRLLGVEVRDPKLCPRYSARIVTGLQVAPSPLRMRLRLEACGIRAINSIVDVTNYVMLETGQPLHAFDTDRLTKGRIVIRAAKGTKRFVTLDGIERELVPEDLLICDGDVPVALAGVMGGLDSEVGPETNSVLLESAHFSPLAIRRTAKRLGLHTEASHRFERGVDPEGTLYALNRAASLLKDLSGGTPLKGVVDRYLHRFRAKPISLRDQKISALLGVEWSRRQSERILNSLGVKVQARSKQGLRVLAPSHRPDLAREVDLIEELIRIHGYGKVFATLPMVRPRSGPTDPTLLWGRRLRSLFVGEGLTEVINPPFTSREMNQRFHGLWEGTRTSVTILNPLKQESSEMRMSLIPGLIGNLRSHIDQKGRDLSCFELGKVFSRHQGGQSAEKRCLAGILYGRRERRGLRSNEAPFSFLDLKGLVESAFESCGVEPAPAWRSKDIATYLHPGKSSTIELAATEVGFLGEIHPGICEELDTPTPLLFELDFGKLVQYARLNLTAHALPRFPAVQRDMAVVVDEGFPAQQIINWIKDQEQLLIEDVRIFDQYRGAPIPEGKKSLTYTLSYRAHDRTLTDEEVNTAHKRITSQMCQVFDASLRE